MTSQGVITPQQLLERFKESHPALDSVQKIVDFGDANTPEAREAQFVRQYGPELADGDREARQIYRAALTLSERAVLLWANLRDAVAPHFQQTLFNNLPQELPQAFIDKQASTPGYDRLFGNLDFVECEHYRSIFGPAAYFVDLMRFVQQNITDKNPIPPENRLQQRRPDLSQIPLDASQTSDLIPYIDLVNELLEAFVVAAEGDRDTYEALRREAFPMALPFDLPLTEIRAYLKQLKTSLHQVYQTFSRAEAPEGRSRRLLTQEVLGLSPQDFSLIVSEISQPTELARHYGGVSLGGADSLNNVDVFLKQTGLTHQQLNELLTQDLDRHEVNAGLPRLFFINNVDDGQSCLTLEAQTADLATPPVETLLNLSPQKLDRIYRFLRLWRKLGWSITEVDQVLRSLAPPPAVESALQFDGVNDQVVVSGLGPLDGPAFTVEAWVSPTRPGPATLLAKGDRSQQQVHFALGLNADNQLTFYGRHASGDPFQRQTVYRLPVDEFTHVAVAVTAEAAQIYINGTLDENATLRQAIAPVGADVTIGRGFGDEGFAGVIKDVRLWNVARTQAEIAHHRYRRVAAQGSLAGYWPLTPAIDNRLADLSGYGALGQLGGEGIVTQPRWVQRDLILDPLPHAQPAPADNSQHQLPSVVEVTRPVPAAPLEMTESVLQLDGENDVLVVTNPKNWGLGRFDRWTVEFWFSAANTPDPGHKQVLLTQGDREAGLSIYLVNSKIQVVEWCKTFGQDDFRSSVITMDGVSRDVWHHVAVVHDEFPTAPAPESPQSPQVQAFLDGAALSPNPHHAFPMSPVGPIYLGGLAQGQVTRFAEAYTAPEQDDRHCFTGQMAEFRLWRTARSPESRNRSIAPDITPDLLAYLPLEAPQSGDLPDLAGHQHDNSFVGRLQARQMALQTRHTDANLEHIYRHYVGSGALSWQNYSYAGRMRIVANPQVSHGDDAIGVTVLSRYPNKINQYYRLSRDAEHPSFRLTAHPEGIQTLKSVSAERDTTVSSLQPQVNRWYRFLIRVEDTGSRTLIRAKLWADGEPEPDGFQLQAQDDHAELRLTAGTIGLWGVGRSTQHRQFDDLRVWPLAIDLPTQDDLWLDNSFEAQSNLSDPARWQDMGDRVTPLPVGDRLFRLLEVTGRDLPSGFRTLGTESTLTNIHAHYRPSGEGATAWQNYTYSGQLRITDGAGGIGVTVLSQHPEYSGPAHSHRYYSLRRDAHHPTFHLSAYPAGVQRLQNTSQASSQIDSGVDPKLNTWYRFEIQVSTGEHEARTAVRAKVWEAGTQKPSEFQMKAKDESGLRLQSGTVGIWATGAGAKYFDQLVISQGVLLTENFETYSPGAIPRGWFGTGEDNSRDEDSTLFKVVGFENNAVFGTEVNKEDIHAHYREPGALQWRNYSYQGKLYTGGNVGVTFLSRYPKTSGEHNYYYRLRANPSANRRKFAAFRIDVHRGGRSELVVSRSPEAAFSDVVPEKNTWYRFRIDVETLPAGTHIRAKVWKADTPEPSTFQIDVTDISENRLEAGTVGVWATRSGKKYVDDLRVLRGHSWMVDTGSAQWENHWTETPSRDRFETKTDLFTAVDTQDNQLQWATVSNFPLLRHPLSTKALQFERHQLVGHLNEPIALGQLTLSVWVKPDQVQENLLFSLHSSPEGAAALQLGVTAQGQIKLALQSSTQLSAAAISAGDWSHIAVRIAGDAITFWVNGVAESGVPLTRPLALQATALTLGYDEPDQYWAGQLKDLQIWRIARTDEQIVGRRFQQLLQPEMSPDLIGYWPLIGSAAEWGDRSSQGIMLQPSRPQDPPRTAIALPDSGFWRGQRQVLRLDGQQQVQYIDGQEPRALQQRTVELWFQVADKTTHRKQVIYHEGDGQRGLLIYLYDGALYFAGYNRPAAESRWRNSPRDNPEGWRLDPDSLQRTWRLKTDRIESGQWHHAALVLDGRDELRPQALRGYLDGKLAAVGPGSKLWQHRVNISLGGVTGAVEFHDGLAEPAGSLGAVAHGLKGHILQVCLWDGLCTSEEIAAHQSEARPSSAAASLALLWNFDQADGVQVADGSSHNRDGRFHQSPQRPTLQQSLVVPLVGLSPMTLDEAALHNFAAIKQLRGDRSLALNRLAALWSPLKHTGRADGRPLFDQLFNPEGSAAARWRYRGQPIRWDRMGQEDANRDRQTRARLMGALQVSNPDLDKLVAYLSGDETIVTLDSEYLTQLYRLTQLPRLLRVTVTEFLVLLTQMSIKAIATLADVQAVSDRVSWMQRSGITIMDLLIFNKPVEDAPASFYSEVDLRTLAQQLQSQASRILVDGESFVTTDISQAQSLAIFAALVDSGVLEVIDSPRPDISAETRATVTSTLLNSGSLNSGSLNLGELSRHAELVAAVLAQTQSDLAEAAVAGLAELMGTSTDLAAVVIDFLDGLAQDAATGEPTGNTLDAIAVVQLISSIGSADSPVPPSLSLYLAKLVKLHYLLTKFELSASEAQAFLAHPELILAPVASSIPLAALLQPSLDHLDRLAQYQRLKAAFEDDSDQLITVLQQGPIDIASLSADASTLTPVTKLTGWEPRQLITLAQALTGTSQANNHNQIDVWSRFEQCFALAASLGNDVGFLIELSSTDQLDGAFYRQQADVLRQVMRASYSEAEWEKVYKPIRDQLVVQKRDALLALAMKTLPDNYLGRKSPDILYEYFLLDVQVGSEVQTSRIVQATASLQLYVQRCLMNLEAGVDPSKISLTEWEWVKNYRVWEANRKVFLYPENYIEPELRRNKTPLFEELEQNLLQSNIDQAAVERVYITYLDQFAELAKLKVVSSYLHRELEGDPNPGHETLYLIGRTDTDPGLYYLRQQVKDDKGVRWLPWEKIDLAINSDFATPVYAFGKLILFWTEFMPLQKSQDRRLPEFIRNRYQAKLLQALFEGALETITVLRDRWVTDNDRGDFWSGEVRRLQEMTPTDGYFKYLSDSLRKDRHTRVRDKKRYRTLRNFKRDIDSAIRQLEDARTALESAGSGLAPEEVNKLDQGEWTIDDDHYLYDTRIVGRVQHNVDIYQTVVKYSYYNFGKTWISPQTYLKTDLSKNEYEQVKWHSLYAQRTIDFTPTAFEAEPKEDKDPQVLQVDVNTRVSLLLPDFGTKALTWSFWVKFDSFNADFQYPGSTAEEFIDEATAPVLLKPEDVRFEPSYNVTGRQQVNQDDLQQSLTLLNYDHGRFRVTATNKVEPIAGAQAREEAVAKAFVYTHEALEDIGPSNPTAATLEKALADLKEIPKSSAGETATGNSTVDREINSVRGAVEDAAQKKSEAVQARQEASELRAAATKARGAATEARAKADNEPENSSNKQSLENAATQAEGEATTKEAEATAKENQADSLETEASDKISEARHDVKAAEQTAREQLEQEFQKPKWESKTMTLAVDFGDREQALETKLDMNVWRHVAVVLDAAEENSKSGYQTKIFCHRQDNASPTGAEKFLETRLLPRRETLDIGRQMAPVDVFTTKMSEFQLQNQVRSEAMIKSERFNRKTTRASLFSVPLNTTEVSSNMTLTQGKGLTLTIPIEFQGDLPDRLTGSRERIIIFYGDNVKSIRNSLKDQSFTLSFDSSQQENYDVRLRSYRDSNDKPTQTALSLVKESSVSIRDFANTGEGNIFDAPDFTPNHESFVIQKLQNQEVTFIDVHNRPGWYVVDTSDDQFLVKAVFLNSSGEELPVLTAAELMNVAFKDAANTSSDQVQAIAVSLNLPPSQAPATNAVSSVKFEFERLDTYAIYELSKNLFTGGIDKFLSVESQRTEELDFWATYQPNTDYVPRDRNQIATQIDFEGSYALYYEEIFFHIPFLIANQLNTNQQFAEAQRWYHYIFNPTAADSTSGSSQYWQYLPFRDLSLKRLDEILTSERALTAYREDPFDPHAIAALRMTAYQKAIIMKYIDNLLDWGDSLFAQDTRESVTEAMLLYVLAFNLLGPRPVGKQMQELDEVGTYEDFSDRYDSTIEFLTQVEGASAANANHTSRSPHSRLISHFCIPENEKFIGYWDLVEDRLYKIRHSLNIEGIFRQQALFQPPIDPAALVQAVAGGQGIGGGLADVSGSVPHYRYGAVLEQAKEVVSMVMDFGTAFFEALEAKEDGQLGSLQFTHERNILNLTTTLKAFEVSEAQGEIEALEISKENVIGRQEYYQGLLEDGTAGLSLNPSEAMAMIHKNASKGADIVSGVFEVFSKMAKFPPNIEFGISGFGGSPVAGSEIDSDTLASIPEANAAYFGSIAKGFDLYAELNQDLGAYTRRYAEWESEKSTADVDLEEINKQIELAEIRLSRAEFEQTIHSKAQQQHQEVADFYRSKFVNGELRSWMVGRLSGLYFQVYKLAYDLAKAAEKALQYELPTTQSFITPVHWDSLRKGLLAGESLMLELNRMDKVRLDQDSRFQDIEKVISMRRTFPDQLDQLKQSGVCDFSLSEQLFNRDFPGHYCRLIKTIAISIAPRNKIDPYDAVHATLHQTSSKTLLVPDISAVGYLMGAGGDQPSASVLRSNWRSNQQIAISKPTEDLGMFTLDFFRDDRYFPFEGTGAVSQWRLEMPMVTNPALVNDSQLDIEDVVIHLRYTSKFDRGAFKNQVEDLMKI